MHELGILRHVVKTVSRISQLNEIEKVRYITLEVGKTSGFVPYYLNKLFPIATDAYSIMRDAVLRIEMVDGDGLVIKDIGY